MKIGIYIIANGKECLINLIPTDDVDPQFVFDAQTKYIAGTLGGTIGNPSTYSSFLNGKQVDKPCVIIYAPIRNDMDNLAKNRIVAMVTKEET